MTFTLHIALDVADLERSIAFYDAFLDRAPTKRKPNYAKYELTDPGLVLTLNATVGVRAGGSLSHLGLRVGDDAALRSAHARIVEAGLAVDLEEEQVTCCYAVQDKFWVRDPDGNAWEIYRFLEDSDAQSDAQAGPVAVGGDACCPTTPIPAGQAPGTSCC